MTTEYVLVDFENVQPADLAQLAGGSYKIKIFLGTQQLKIPVSMARDLHAFGPNVEYIQAESGGKNAMDFFIACYIGELASAAPGSRFHVISRDTGFDPLLAHLEKRGIHCRRSPAIADISSRPAVKSGSESLEDKVKVVVGHLAKLKAAKPRTLRTLRSSIKARLGTQATDENLDRLLELLAKRGVMKVVDGKVHYEL